MEAWVTLVTNDNYAVGALTLAASLKRVKTTKKLAIMITNTVSENIKNTLDEVFDEVISVEAMDSGDMANLTLLERTELGITFTKVRCWTLTQYTKCVFLDADTLVLQNCDELFEREELSAAPDAGWPDCFNSGVFVFRPNLDTYKELVSHAVTSGSFDGGDQGLLNTFFSDWSTRDISRHLPFTYNMVASASYSYLPAYKQFGQHVKIIHFIGAAKPWLVSFDGSGQPRVGYSEKNMLTHLTLWWQIFSTEVKPALAKNSSLPDNTNYIEQTLPCMSTAMGSTFISSPPPPPQDTREAWEAGTPDYTGTARFDNILEKINKTLNE
eukprot:GFUD01010869.1.p1 GENE.GFUD01010869.1~~GFUD01010869.1.p1  ORF type:complete len:346 (+),score=100.07 GFUD01010869.1:63-1040(+)